MYDKNQMPMIPMMGEGMPFGEGFMPPAPVMKKHKKGKKGKKGKRGMKPPMPMMVPVFMPMMPFMMQQPKSRRHMPNPGFPQFPFMM